LGAWFRWGSILLATISVFSLTQKLFGFGFAPIVQDLVSFYKATLYPVANIIHFGLAFVFGLFGIKLPDIPRDIIIIYFILGGTLARASYYRRGESRLRAAVMFLTWPLMLLFFMNDIDTPYGGEDSIEHASFWVFEIITVIVTFAILFTTNAYFST
jgi:hypothetical protein